MACCLYRKHGASMCPQIEVQLWEQQQGRAGGNDAAALSIGVHKEQVLT